MLAFSIMLSSWLRPSTLVPVVVCTLPLFFSVRWFPSYLLSLVCLDVVVCLWQLCCFEWRFVSSVFVCSDPVFWLFWMFASVGILLMFSLGPLFSNVLPVCQRWFVYICLGVWNILCVSGLSAGIDVLSCSFQIWSLFLCFLMLSQYLLVHKVPSSCCLWLLDGACHCENNVMACQRCLGLELQSGRFMPLLCFCYWVVQWHL